MASDPLEQKDEAEHRVAVGDQMGEGFVVQRPQLGQLGAMDSKLFDQGGLSVVKVPVVERIMEIRKMVSTSTQRD